jgi:hypothetical protein
MLGLASLLCANGLLAPHACHSLCLYVELGVKQLDLAVQSLLYFVVLAGSSQRYMM